MPKKRRKRPPARSLRRAAVLLAVALLVAGSWWAQPVSWAAVTPQQRAELNSMQSAARRGQNLLNQGDTHGAAEAAREAQEIYERLLSEGDGQLLTQLGTRYDDLKELHALLELEGVILDPLADLAEAEPAMESLPAEGGAGGVSFVSQVAPILVAKCGNCHVSGDRGDFQMASFTQLMRGSPNGIVVRPGSPEGSHMIKLIEEGDMPRGNLTISAQELELLRTWISEGCRFDGTNPNANLDDLAMAAPATPSTPAVVMPTGNETVSFSGQLAGVLNEQCSGCHGPNRQRAGLSVANFTQLMEGGDTGSPITPGSSGTSLLIAKLEGTAEGQQMPLNRDPLPAEVIAQFKTWIDEGATFDGTDVNLDLATLATQATIATATHEELTQLRRESALANLQLALPGEELSELETENFLLLGNVPNDRLAPLGEQAEAIALLVAEELGAPAGQPLVKGRLTLFVLPQRYDYSEFGNMVERRRLPSDWRGHWRYSGVDAYGAFVPASDPAANAALLGRILAGVYTAGLGDVPPWFSEGTARLVASRLQPEDENVQSWNDALPAVIATVNGPNEVLNGTLSPEESELVAYGFVRYLATNRTRYNALLKSLREGEPFETAFSDTHRGTPEGLAQEWLSRGGR